MLSRLIDSLSSKPENCSFTVEDAEGDWNHTEPWDYIHARASFTCFADPKFVFQKAYDGLAPGGYLEIQDPILPWKFVEPPPEDSAFARWNRLSIEASHKGGRPWDNVQYYPKWFTEIGFEDIETKVFRVPLGSWPDDPLEVKIGTWSMLNTRIALEAWTFRNLERIGWTAEQTKALIKDVKEELRTGTLRGYTEFQVVHGRKPQ